MRVSPMRYREQHPETTIGRWIEGTWSLETAEAVPAYPVRPDGCIDIVYARESGAQVVGAMTTERRFHLAAGARTMSSLPSRNDQAHLIRDFREFTGVTPMAVFSKTQTASIGDRKSTRLNSSHLGISYAVFCL